MKVPRAPPRRPRPPRPRLSVLQRPQLFRTVRPPLPPVQSACRIWAIARSLVFTHADTLLSTCRVSIHGSIRSRTTCRDVRSVAQLSVRTAIPTVGSSCCVEQPWATPAPSRKQRPGNWWRDNLRSSPSGLSYLLGRHPRQLRWRRNRRLGRSRRVEAGVREPGERVSIESDAITSVKGNW